MTMKAHLALGFAMLLSSLTTLLPPAAYGGACPRGCARQAKACVQAARVSLRGCLAGCRATPATASGCTSACTDTFKAAKGACSTDRATCAGMCPPLPPLSSCVGAFLDTCGQELGVCARGVIAQAKQCVQACAGVADRVACLGGCGAAAQTGATQCFASFDTCVGRCRPPTTTTTTLPGQPCTSDAQCNDGNGCTVDRCVDGTCEHACVCVDATGAASCCPGPAALCVRPCGMDGNGVCGGACPASNEVCTSSGTTCACVPVTPPCGADTGGMCGGTCPTGAICEQLATAATPTCRCVSGLGGPCGGNISSVPPVCSPGLICQQSNPDVTGVCVQATCIPFFANGCTQTSDCCEPCTVLQRAPCAVCLQGQCVGTP
jgi:hypothetical protein